MCAGSTLPFQVCLHTLNSLAEKRTCRSAELLVREPCSAVCCRAFASQRCCEAVGPGSRPWRTLRGYSYPTGSSYISARAIIAPDAKEPPEGGGGGGAVKRCVYTQVCAVGTSTTNYDRFGNSILGKRSSPSCPAPFGSYQLFSEHKAKSRCAAAFRGLIDPGKSLSFPCQSRRRAAVVEKSNRIRELRFQSNIALLARSLLHRCPLLMEHSETTIEV